MQQRQLRLGDILDDYCPRERRVTNHAVVAMVGADVKQTRCTTCDAEHEYKHAKIPRQRRKADAPAALYSQVAANGPKRIAHEPAPVAGAPAPSSNGSSPVEGADEGQEAVVREAVTREVVTIDAVEAIEEPQVAAVAVSTTNGTVNNDTTDSIEDDLELEDRDEDTREEGPVHRPLIRASLPRPEGTPPPTRPVPEFTIRQPGGRPSRFRPRHARGGGGGGQPFHGNRSTGNVAGGPPRGGMSRQGGMPSRLAKRHGPGRKRSK